MDERDIVKRVASYVRRCDVLKSQWEEFGERGESDAVISVAEHQYRGACVALHRALSDMLSRVEADAQKHVPTEDDA